MTTVFSSYFNAEIMFDVFSGTFLEDPSTLNMIQETRQEIVFCMLRRPKTQVEELIQPGNDQKAFTLKGHAVKPKYLPRGLSVGNVGTIVLFDRASGNSQKGLFEILDLQQSVHAIVSQVKGHAITGYFRILETGGVGLG